MASKKGKPKYETQNLPYTRLEKEVKLRIETQMKLLEEQKKRLDREQTDLFNSVLARSGIELTSKDQVKFYPDHAEVIVEKEVKHGSRVGKDEK